jgi:hypothetical protein
MLASAAVVGGWQGDRTADIRVRKVPLPLHRSEQAVLKRSAHRCREPVYRSLIGMGYHD